MQVLTEELEVANSSLQKTNQILDRRVAERTGELAEKNVVLTESERRFRNILTVVRSVVDRTVVAKGTLEDVVGHLRGRLDALGRTQVVVTQSSRGVVDLEGMIRDELLSVGASDGPNLSIEGPDLELPADIAEPVGLAIHELTTNALKYGAPKVQGARLDIRWTVDSRGGAPARLHLVWAEQGVPALVLNPARSGFGRELIEEALPYQLGAETSLRFHGGGITCTLSVPLSEEERGA